MVDDKLRRRLSKIVKALVRRGLPLDQARKEFEKQYILAALRAHGGSFGKAATALGVHRNTLRNKILTLGIDVEQLRNGSPKPLPGTETASR